MTEKFRSFKSLWAFSSTSTTLVFDGIDYNKNSQVESDIARWWFPLRACLSGRQGLGGCALALILFFTSCSPKSPQDILPKKEMARALTQFYLTEAKINNLHVGQDSSLVLFKYFRERYAEQNHFADSVIDKSYRYYLDHPKDLNDIYDIIIDSLVLKEQRATLPVTQPK